jgi:nucleoside-diphosphate-sugar epimerase
MSVALVTGANGFLGQFVCRELAGRNVEVVTLNRSIGQGVARWILLPQPLTRAYLIGLLDEIRPDTVYHLAGTSRSDNLDLLYQVNVLYAAELIEAALVSKCRPTVVLVGSAAEYGRPIRPNYIVRESDRCSPMTAYGISKLAQTHHGIAATIRGLPVVVTRLFNPIGVGSTQTNALGNFVAQIAAMGPEGGILKTGPLGAVRDFIHVADAAKALVELGNLPEAAGQVINLCTGVGTRLQYVVDRLIALAAIPLVHEIDDQRRGTSDLDGVIGDAGLLKRLGIAVATPEMDSLLRDLLAKARQEGFKRSSVR